MSLTACVITDHPQHKSKLTKFLTNHPLIDPAFPRNIQQIFELAQQSSALLVLIALSKMPDLSLKICLALKKHPHTKNTPIVLVQYTSPTGAAPLVDADAYLREDFSTQDLEQVIRQLTMGY